MLRPISQRQGAAALNGIDTVRVESPRIDDRARIRYPRGRPPDASHALRRRGTGPGLGYCKDVFLRTSPGVFPQARLKARRKLASSE